MYRVFSTYLPSLVLSFILLPILATLSHGSNKKVLTTILPLYIFTGNILTGIDDVDIVLLIDGENANPHTFSISLLDIKNIASADVIIANGKAEEFLDIEALKEINPRANIVLVQQVSVLQGDLPAVDPKNPHTWLSPKRAIIECRTIGKTLKEAFPEYRHLIEVNMERFIQRLQKLSGEISALLESAKQLEVITFHDALDIFAADYGVTILSHIEDVHGISPSPKKLSAIVHTISKRGGKVLLVGESPVPDEITIMIASKTKAPTVWFDPVISGKKDLHFYEETLLGNVKKLVSSFTM